MALILMIAAVLLWTEPWERFYPSQPLFRGEVWLQQPGTAGVVVSEGAQP